MASPPAKALDTESDANPTAESMSLLADDAFSSERSQKLFEAIDELQSCGANRDIDLPELVIVGDQSAGKSSLLQSLTDIPFPVAGRLCTRFPTRIVSRRTPGETDLTRISIEANDTGPFSQSPIDERRRQYAKFTRSSPTFTAEEFLKVVEKATNLMGIADGASSELGNNMLHASDEVKHFSSDVLRVEVSGPKRSYFSILDLPGVFQSLTKNLTAKEKSGVRDLVALHMKPKQSVIVCVASGTNDLANQAIFDMASQYDPEGERTVGVITKCDATQHISQVLELAQNQEKHFHHGWFVVRNRTPAEAEANLEAQDRDKREESFFENRPWNTLPRSRRGVQALKKYLADLLCTRIQMGFPLMLETIQSRRLLTASQLEALGQTREMLQDKRAYLSNIGEKFHNKALDALQGRYGTIKKENMKLRKIIRDTNDTFMQEITQNGHLRPFAEIPDVSKIGTEAGCSPSSLLEPRVADSEHDLASRKEVDGSGVELDASSCSESGPDVRSNKGASHAGYGGSLFASGPSPFKRNGHTSRRLSRASTPSKRKSTPQPASNEQTPVEQFWPKPSPEAFSSTESTNDIYSWIGAQVEASKGTELQGTLNPEVLANLFQTQASKWGHIAEAHLDSIVKGTTAVLKDILDETDCDSVTRRRVWPKIDEAAKTQKEERLAQLKDRMHDIETKHLQTNNPSFSENVAKARRLRFQAALYRYQRSKLSHHRSASTDTRLVIDLRETSALFGELHISNSRNLENEIHDILKAYYEIARDDFITFVTQLVVEKFVDNERGPVRLFSPAYVIRLSEADIADLATEDEELVRQRTEKAETLARLKQAEKIALRYV